MPTDQPIGNLGTAKSDAVFSLLNPNKTEGTTLVLVTHDPV